MVQSKKKCNGAKVKKIVQWCKSKNVNGPENIYLKKHYFNVLKTS
jgi:hypothetical protein